jgi:hypothetical protein
VPDETGWTVRHRFIVCFLVMDTPVTRSLRVDADTLDDAQERYLRAVKPFNELLGEMSSEDPKPTWEELRLMAMRMVLVHHAEQAALKAGPWPSGAQKAIDRLIAEADLAIPLWRKASKAKTEDQLYDYLDQASDHLGHEAARDVREALGLTT